jgi:hypothetical protein
MTLTAGGNLLVGTTIDAGRLTVSGKIRTIGGDIELDSGQITTNSSANPLRFGVDGSERARIDSSGNFGLGVTPSAWGSNFKAFQISSGGGSVSGNSRGVNVNNNCYNDNTNWLYFAGGLAARYNVDAGTHAWFTAPSGTAGNAISFTQAMTLTAGGRWLLGTTTGVGNDFASIRFNSAGSFPQGLNMVDSNASANGAVFQVFRKSDDTYLGNIRRNGTDNAIYVGGNSYLALGSGDTEQMRLTSTGLGIGTSSPTAKLTVSGGSVMSRFQTGSATDGRIEFAYNTTDIGYINMASSSLLDITARSGVSLAFGANGSEGMRLTSTGLGIGTSSPTVKLQVAGGDIGLDIDRKLILRTSDPTAAFLSYTASTTIRTYLQSQYGIFLGKDYGAGNGLFLDTSGNLGIGTSSPSSKLVVSNAGAAGFEVNPIGSASAPAIYSYNRNTSAYGILTSISSEARWQTGSSPAETMRLDSSGNLGIGTSSPNEKLVVAGRGIFNVADASYATAFNATNGNLRITPYEDANLGTNLRAFSAGYAGLGPLSFDASRLLFYTGSSERMRLDSSGNLGIGTSSPSYKLSVNGDIAVLGQNTLRLQNSDNTNAYALQNAGASGGGNSYLSFVQTGVAERMRLDSSGNLGLGVTPSAWGVGRAIEVGGSGAVYGDGITAAWTAGLAQNAYLSTGGTWRYRTTGIATARYNINNDTHQWFTAPSGTAGNAITFTQAMTLDASGRLGVGTTSPLTTIHAQGAGATLGGLSNVVSSIYDTSVSAGVRAVLAFGTTNGATTPVHAAIGAVRESSTATNPEGGLVFYSRPTGGGNLAERARIDSSGNLLVGTTNTTFSSGGIRLYANNSLEVVRDGVGLQANVYLNKVSNDGDILSFNRAGTQVGVVTVTTTATSYGTSSDYRLKNTIAPMTGALAKVALLKPCTYKWNANGSDGEGFIAHELAEVVPQCVTGEKDAVDAEGKPQYQGIDTSFLVATLTAAIQEQQAIINSLKARLDAANL